MQRIKIIVRDRYRYAFKRHKSFDVRNISIWKVNSFTVEEREYGIKCIETWLRYNKSICKDSKQNINDLTFEGLTERISNNNNEELFLKIYTLFNRRKFIPNSLSNDLKPLDKIISLKAYCNFSKILLEKYEKEKNIQYLNTSLKVNDFLLYCQINSQNNNYSGAITNTFPCKFSEAKLELNTNQIFLNNLKQELNYIKSL